MNFVCKSLQISRLLNHAEIYYNCLSIKSEIFHSNEELWINIYSEKTFHLGNLRETSFCHHRENLFSILSRHYKERNYFSFKEKFPLYDLNDVQVGQVELSIDFKINP